MAKTLKRKPLRTSKIFLVEDHPTFCEGLAQVLESETDLTICGTAGTADEALKAIARLEPDLVLVDITLPGKSGLELIKELRSVNRKVKLLVLSMHDEALYADRVLRAGGDGYIMKQEDTDEIVHAIRDVLDGHIYVSEAVMTGGANGSAKHSSRAKAGLFDKLTDLELEILALIGQGRSNAEIGRQLRLSPRKIPGKRMEIRKKLKLKNADALVRYAVCWVETGVK
jgi:DNA-binding NarL/FixJ family response regulator